MVNIARIVKAQGIKGEVKVFCLLDDSKQLSKLKRVYLQSCACDIEYCRSVNREYAVVKLSCIVDRNQAEQAVGEELFVDREQLDLADGRYLIDELIGLKIYLDNGAYVGKLTALSPCVSADIIYFEGGKKGSFPFLADLVVSTDVESGKMTLNATRFSEVCLYED